MYLPEASVGAVSEAVAGMKPGKGDILLVLLAENGAPDVPSLISELNRRNVTFMGGIFPGLIRGNVKHDTGAILIRVPAEDQPLLITHLDRDTIEIPPCEALSGPVKRHRTAIVLVDGFAPNIAAVLEGLFGYLGNSIHYLGGGAGRLTQRNHPCVFTRDGCFENAAVVGFVRSDSSLGVRHGWEQLGEPVVATKTRQNVIVNLNWRNALEVYREIVESDSGRSLHTDDRFYAVAANYPFGIMKEAAEDVVRDPFVVNEHGEITCVGDIPENAVLNILKYRRHSLIGAAEQAAKDCLAANVRHRRQALVFDCVSRSMLLKDDFTAELDSVHKSFQAVGPDLIPEGVLSLGEICSYGDGYLDYFNKTIVVGMLYDA